MLASFDQTRCLMWVNTRILQAPLTGVQRYLREVLNAWPGEQPKPISPPAYATRGAQAHAWEQFVLPLRARGRLLWSPVHSGPIAYRNQVVTVHDVVPLDHPEWLNNRFARWYRWMLPRLIKRARHVIAISEFSRQRIMATTGVPETQISVVTNGVSEAFRPVSDEQKQAMHRRFGLDRAPYLLSVGSLEPRKNLLRLLKAWQQALPRLPGDYQLVIAGALGDPRVFANAGLPQWPDRVRVLGRVDDEWMPALYAAADWFVYLSLYEGFGLPPLEAMACGTPVLVSDIDVMQEVVGNDAVRVSPLDVDAITLALQQITRDTDLRQQRAQGALERARLFSWQQTAEKTCGILNRFA